MSGSITASLAQPWRWVKVNRDLGLDVVQLVEADPEAYLPAMPPSGYTLAWSGEPTVDDLDPIPISGQLLPETGVAGSIGLTLRLINASDVTVQTLPATVGADGLFSVEFAAVGEANQGLYTVEADSVAAYDPLAFEVTESA